MKILDYGNNKPNEEPKVLRCTICGAQFELETGEKVPTKCPLCGAKELTATNKKEKSSNVKLHPIAEVYPGKYYSFSSNATANEFDVQKMIAQAMKVYYENNSGYAFCETAGFFVAVFQEDENDKDNYFVVITDKYKEISSYELEEE